MQIVFLIGAYLLGAIPFGVLITRAWAGQDVRCVGSGNIGATNVARAAGKRAAGLVLLLDVLKGFIPAAAALLLLDDPWSVATIGFAAFVGHVFPIYLGFRGGKGVATALGVCLALVPAAALIGALVYLAVFKLSRTSSLGSLCAGVVGAGAAFALAPERPYAWIVLAMVVLILLRHRSNIGRLLSRSEPTV